MTERGAAAVAVAAGALTFLLATFLRIEATHYLKLAVSAHWLGSINALMIYVTTLSAGLVTGLLRQRHVLVIGFLAGVAGELTRGLINLVMASHAAGWVAIISLPLGYFMDVAFAAITTGVLSSAGAAVAIVITGRKQTTGQP